jgi:hypothetical protein
VNNRFDKEHASLGAAGFYASSSQLATYFPTLERNLWLALNYRFE